MSNDDIIEIDGSFGEGGGSILRLSAGYSVLFNRPIKIKNIRANRPKPGLRLQHLLGLKTLAELTNSKLSDCKVGTRELTFTPNSDAVKKSIQVKIGTAASIGLLLQPIQIACFNLTKPEKIEISLEGGGTFGKWAPSLNYLKEVTYQILKSSGITIDIDIETFGFYPKGGGKTRCTIYPPKKGLTPIKLTELGNIDLIQGEIIISNQLKRNNANIVSRIKRSILQQLKKEFKMELDMKHSWVNSLSPGVGLSLWARSDTGACISTGTILGERKISSETLGIMAAKDIATYIINDIPVDNFLSDQLLPLMGYVKAPSSIKVREITNHAKTNLELIKLFANRDYVISEGTKKKNFLIEYQ